MIRHAFLLLPILFHRDFVNGQILPNVLKIDSIVSTIDSIERNAVNIEDFIVIKHSDSDTTRLYNHYILDTVKRDFYKCIYDCTFRGLEEITFYFVNRELIKIIVKTQEANQNPFNATYYFDKGINVYKQGDLAEDTHLFWKVDELRDLSKSYLRDMDGIINYLDGNKK